MKCADLSLPFELSSLAHTERLIDDDDVCYCIIVFKDREATQTGCVKTKPAKPHTVRERDVGLY